VTKKHRLAWTLLLFAPLLFGACTTGPEPVGTAITHVTVIDAVGGARENHTVIFDGDEIIAVGPSDSELPPAVETIDGSGQYLLPGLWDMHVHLTYDDAYTEAMPGLFLSHGITSVRDTGGMIDKLQPVIEKMRAPDALAPRVFFSGPLLDGEFVVYDGESNKEIGISNTTVAAAEANVADLKAAGVDFIKIYEMVTPEVFEALVQAGRSHGLPIAAHVPLSMTAREAGPKVDSMEHLRNVELECAANAVELHEARVAILNEHEEGPGAELRSRLHGLQHAPAIEQYDEERCKQTIASLASTIQVPTLRLNTLARTPPFERDDWEALLAKVPEAARPEWEAFAEAFPGIRERWGTSAGDFSLALVGQMHAAGVPIGAGTDTPIGVSLPGDSLHTELQRLVEAGLTPLEAIEAATIRPAEFFSLENEMGTIEVGRRADLVLLDANPLENIVNTRSIAAVVTRGRLLRPEDLN
jgi:imidazolonepropionase-like amidohydrolase